MRVDHVGDVLRPDPLGGQGGGLEVPEGPRLAGEEGAEQGGSQSAGRSLNTQL